MVVKARYNYAKLAKSLAAAGKNEKAVQVLDYCMETFPVGKLSYDMYVPDIVEAYFDAGEKEKAEDLTNKLSVYYFEKLDYYFRQKVAILSSAEYEIETSMQYVSRVANACKANGKTELADKLNSKVNTYYNSFMKALQPNIR
jgi:hypothetical protein